MELTDFGGLFSRGLRRVAQCGGKDDDFFIDITVGNDIREAVADRIVDDDIETSFFFDFAEGGFYFGLAGFDVAFREAPMVVSLVFEEEFAIVNDGGTAGFFFNHG